METSRHAPPTTRRRRTAALHALWAAVGAVTLLAGCGGGDAAPAPQPAASPPAPTGLACDDTMKTAFKPDANTTVTLVKAFKAGEPIALSGTPASPTPQTAPHGLCLVKLNIGPGNPGPAGAPSTSAGIGVEVWLPAPDVWNRRLQLNGTGGFGSTGPGIRSTTDIGSAVSLGLAIGDKAVSAETDHGHTTGPVAGTFLMNPDGSINTTLWKDFADRAVHEMALKVKALANAYYLSTPDYSYFAGCSGGGRDGYSLAQQHPEDFDGILIGAPAINWTQFITNEAYPQIVMQRDLGGVPLTAGQRKLVSAAAVSACDANLNGQHDGYISDPTQCRYDPTKDASVLCMADGGTNATASCVSKVQANAMNKMWYGQTVDGSVPDPQADLGQQLQLSPNQLWFGVPRGSDLSGLAGGPADPPFLGAFPIAMNQLALTLQDPTIGLSIPSVFGLPTKFTNATGDGQDRWKTLGYFDLANAYSRSVALQALFGNINTDNPDLTKVRDRKGKILTYHGMHDQLVAHTGSVNYYTRSANVTGGFVETQKFHRLFLIPGMGHCEGHSMDGIAGISPPAAANVPLPVRPQFEAQLFTALKDWVEKDTAPEAIVMSNPANTNSRPLCPYPMKITFVGGDVTSAASYACR